MRPGIRTRLLAFNALLVFLPAGGLLFLDAHERRLLEDQERVMAQQARMLASALSGAALDSGIAERALSALGQRSDARIRVVDAAGRAIADSVRGSGERGGAPGSAATRAASPRDGWLYRAAALPFRLWRRLRAPAAPHSAADLYAAGGPLLGPEVRAALAGRYGAATRISSGGQRSVTLYSAVPVRDDSGRVTGAVLVAQSTWRILQALYELRLGALRLVLLSAALAVVLSLIVSRTIARPLRSLRDQAARMLDGRGTTVGRFETAARDDEIADLAAALETLRTRLHERVQFAEAFAADVAHEFRNPLASIRTAAEMALDAAAGTERERFVGLIQREVARMDAMLVSLRELGRLDAGADAEPAERIELGAIAAGVARAQSLATGHDVRVTPGPGVCVEAPPVRLGQVLENLIANAIGFSPCDAPVDVEVCRSGPEALLRVLDRGPGVCEAHRERVFERFFSHRPAGVGGESHTGLGLSIARSIVHDLGGSIRSDARPGGGALFEVRLPAC